MNVLEGFLLNNLNTLELIKNKLEEIGFDKEPGSVLYSGNETICKGKFYFLGANPGGHSDQNLGDYPDTVINQLLRKNTSPDFNEYFDGKWQKRGSRPSDPGDALLQRRIKFFFNFIGINLKEVLSTNLVFVRSPTLEEFHLSWDDAADKCWEIHKILLSVVKPDIVIAYGSEANEYIKKKINVTRENSYEVVSINESKFFSIIEGEMSIDSFNKNVKLISIPHLSRYKINAKGPQFGDAYDTRPALDWIKKKIS